MNKLRKNLGTTQKGMKSFAPGIKLNIEAWRFKRIYLSFFSRILRLYSEEIIAKVNPRCLQERSTSFDIFQKPPVIYERRDIIKTLVRSGTVVVSIKIIAMACSFTKND